MLCAKDLTITSLETIMAFDITTDEFLWTLDELQNATIANTEETNDITGKGGRLLNRLKLNKAATVSGTNGFISAGLMGTQVGDEVSTEVTIVKWAEVLEVNGNKASTTYVAAGTAGNEIGSVYICTGNNTLGTKFTQDSAVAAGKFTYNPETKLLTFNSGDIEDGSKISVFYNRRISAQVITNSTDKFSQKVKLFIDGFAEDNCNNLYHVQFFFPAADSNGNFDIAMGDSQATHAFEFTSLAGGDCDNGIGEKGVLWTYKVFEDDAEDVSA